MRYIQKQTPPHEYTKWFFGKAVVDGKRQECSYDQLRGEKAVIMAVENGLVSEQKFLCCYTGIEIDFNSFHVEHLKPQDICTQNEDVDYRNLLAAYPAPNSPHCRFGAINKGPWYDADLFISPLDSSCSTHFHFLRNGTIKPVNTSDEAAKKTIEVLNLNDSILVGLRKAAIEKFIAIAKKLSISKLETIASGKDNGDERLPEFCFVIQQFAPQELKRKRVSSQNRLSQNIKRKRRK